jgi:hypothetical protein
MRRCGAPHSSGPDRLAANWYRTCPTGQISAPAAGARGRFGLDATACEGRVGNLT